MIIMPDVGIPGAEFIFGKENSEIARLLSNITDYATTAKYLNDLYSVSNTAEILGCGYMREDHVVVILNENNLANQRVADILNNSLVSGVRTRKIIDSSDFTHRLHMWIANGVGDLNTLRYGHGGCGTVAAGLCFSGKNNVNTTIPGTEEYTSSVWTNATDVNTQNYKLGGCGTQNAGVKVGGADWETDVCEEYNGSTWSAGGNINTARMEFPACGTQNAGLCFGGLFSDHKTGETEEYNGSAWITVGVGDMAVPRKVLGGCGTQNSGLSFGGENAAYNCCNDTEEYNGSTWAVSGNLNTSRKDTAGCGTQTAGLCFGGNPDDVAMKSSEEYDGSTWATSGVGDLNTASEQHSAAGIQTAGLKAGGLVVYDTEEYI